MLQNVMQHLCEEDSILFDMISMATLELPQRQLNVNVKRDYYLDVYTILNRIKLTNWTICAFRVLNPRE